ncbi:hypothetical protein I4U23_005239 [Adineta vaga]|nr:hypothetical protein I4U23_005239 [Adineta vaga]
MTILTPCRPSCGPKEALRKIEDYLETFENVNECVDYITNVQDEKVLIIVSLVSANIPIALLDKIPQIACIYVLSDSKKDEQEWKNASRKVKAVARDILSICSQLRKDKKTLRDSLINIRLLSTSPIAITGTMTQTENCHREEVLVMYSDNTLDILWQFPLTDKSKHEMTEFCKEVYSDNEVQLRIIDDFKNNYTEDNAFRWYCRDLPDQVAIVLEIEVRVYAGGAFFADLQEYSEFQDEQEILFSMGTLFRVQSITLDITRVWIVQLKSNGEKDQAMGALLPHMRLNIQKSGCAPLNWAFCMLEMGDYDKAEHYYLLLLHDSELVENVYELAQVYNDLGFVYKQKGEDGKALQRYEKALVNLRESALSMDEDSKRLIVLIYISIGNIYSDQNNHEKALEYFISTILLELKGHDPDTSKIATCYRSIGDVYLKQTCYSEALEMYEEALKMKLQVLPPHHPLIAQTCDHLATILYEQGSLKEVLNYKKRAYEIRLKYLTFDRPDLFMTDRQWIVQVEKSIEQSNQ